MSKTYNILSVGSPMLCVAPEKSEIGQLVKKERCGIYDRHIHLHSQKYSA